MAPDACTAAPRAPHVWLHVQDTCRTPPLLPDVRLHDWSSCKAPHILTHVDQHASIACVATSRAWPIHLTPRAWSIHLVLLHVKLHGLLPLTATPQASVDTQLAGQLTPRSELMQRATSSFSVHWPDFGPSGEICPEPPASSKNFIIPKLGFSSNFRFFRRALIPSCLLLVVLASRRA
ncbi:unnamed protein product [Brassica rapa]|uniref:Uncharacterized protein n=1 Tax=Brassica campestris TaxID=3711 RepID=A0A8D9CRB2_BRACM|nr:unnamed protein product [Brassica rapa]